MESTTPESQPANRAPRYTVPGQRIVTVEHPCLVKNVDKAIDMLGGVARLSDALQPTSNKTLSLSFNPKDPGSRTIMSTLNAADNVLLRVTVPKRIGKRKRGSDEPFTPLPEPDSVMRDVKYLLQSMNDNQAKSAVEAVGNIQKSHVWRAMPDFDYSTRGSTFLADIQSKILPQQYPTLQQWSLPKSSSFQHTEVVPPPVFSTVSLPQTYTYHQDSPNPFVDREQSDQELAENATKGFIIQCNNLEPYPNSPSPGAPALRYQTKSTQLLYPKLRDLFTKRPIWTGRALGNSLFKGRVDRNGLRAVAHIAFAIRGGPWNDTYCAFGVDPRSHPKYRKYQTIVLHQDSTSKNFESMETDCEGENQQSLRHTSSRSHIFTGHGPASEVGEVLQLCDLEDAQLKRLVDIDEKQLSKECDQQLYGWYKNGTLTKIRLVLKAKVEALRNGEVLDDDGFERFLQFPEEFHPDGPTSSDSSVVPEGYMPDSASDREKALAVAYRDGCRNAASPTAVNT